MTVTDTYNNDSELTGQSGAGADAATPTRTFGYDTAGHLTSAATSNTAGSGSKRPARPSPTTTAARC